MPVGAHRDLMNSYGLEFKAEQSKLIQSLFRQTGGTAQMTL